MDSKDPPPFGYTFEGADFFGGSPTTLTNGGPSLLSENENQSLLDFFAQDPFLPEAAQFGAHTEAKGGIDDLSWEFVPPPNVHQVSTTIPDQAQLHRGFYGDHAFGPDALSTAHLTSTQDDLQAASTLFNHAQAPLANGRSYSVPSVHSMHGLPFSTPTPSNLTAAFHGLPLASPSHGYVNDQTTSLLQNHAENQMAAQFSQLHAADMAQLERQRPAIKRSYTYGTDSAFNSTGYIGPSPNIDEAVTQRLLHAVQPLMGRPGSGAEDVKPRSSSGHTALAAELVDIPNGAEEQSEEETSSEEEERDRPVKKRRKSKATSAKVEKAQAAQRKSVSAARPARNRKASVDEPDNKKKRPSLAGQKAHRENLTEEQKRSNHILSEQKRRNLIKRGFDDLHELVPEIRNGGLSKSGVLTEAGNFLEKLIEDNAELNRRLTAAGG